MLAFGLGSRILFVVVSEVADFVLRLLFKLCRKEHLISRLALIGAHSLDFSLAIGGLP